MHGRASDVKTLAKGWGDCYTFTAFFRHGGGLGLVALPVFKTGGPAKSGPVGSIPTRLRQPFHGPLYNADASREQGVF